MTDAAQTDTTERDRAIKDFLAAVKDVRQESERFLDSFKNGPCFLIEATKTEDAALSLAKRALALADTGVLDALSALLALGDAVDKIAGVLRVAVCPNCDGSGAKMVPGGPRGLVSREMAMDAGEPDMEGMLYGESEPQLEQCQWCAERERAALVVIRTQAALEGSDK